MRLALRSRPLDLLAAVFIRAVWAFAFAGPVTILASWAWLRGNWAIPCVVAGATAIVWSAGVASASCRVEGSQVLVRNGVRLVAVQRRDAVVESAPCLPLCLVDVLVLHDEASGRSTRIWASFAISESRRRSIVRALSIRRRQGGLAAYGRE